MSRTPLMPKADAIAIVKRRFPRAILFPSHECQSIVLVFDMLDRDSAAYFCCGDAEETWRRCAEYLTAGAFS